MANNMSDELKVQIIKDELPRLIMITKMFLTVRNTIEAQRQHITGELPEDFRETVESPEFIEVYSNAVSALNELIDNLVVSSDNIASLYGMEFQSMLPKTAEEMSKMTRELYEQASEFDKK